MTVVELLYSTEEACIVPMLREFEAQFVSDGRCKSIGARRVAQAAI
jgi:hypothetical protein